MCRNHWVRFLAGHNWPAILVSHFQTRFRSSRDTPDKIVQNQPGSNLVLADCVRFWPNGSGPEASRCARIIRPAQFWPMLPSRSGPDENLIRHVYWDSRGHATSVGCSMQSLLFCTKPDYWMLSSVKIKFKRMFLC